MKNKVSQRQFGKLSEYEMFDGDAFITFNIVDVNGECTSAYIAVTDRGRISVSDYPLEKGKDGRLYFEYGNLFKRIYLDDFAEVA